MKKKILLALSFFIFFTNCQSRSRGFEGKNPDAMVADEAPSEVKKYKVVKLADGFFKSQVEEDLWLVMEKIGSKDGMDKDRFLFWRDFIQRQKFELNKYVEKYRSRLKEGNLPEGRKLFKFHGKPELYLGGVPAFQNALSLSSPLDIWICYALSKDISSIEEVMPHDIEMAVRISTHPMLPLTSHYGITRNFAYLTRILEEYDSTAPRLHSRISMKLHSFAAKVIKTLHPEKVYMHNSPIPAALTILKQGGGDRAYVGDNFGEKRVKGTPYDDLYEELSVDSEDMEPRAWFDEFMKKCDKTKNPSPVFRTHDGEVFQFFTEDFQKEVFFHDRKAKKVRVLGQPLPEEISDEIEWWYSAYGLMNTLFTIPLEVLVDLYY